MAPLMTRLNFPAPGRKQGDFAVIAVIVALSIAGVLLAASRHGGFVASLYHGEFAKSVLVLTEVATLFLLRRQIGISQVRGDALKVSIDRNANTLVTSLDAIIIMNPKGEIVEFNDAASRVFGYSRNAALGARLGDLVVPERHRLTHGDGISYLQSNTHSADGLMDTREISVLRSDGVEVPVEFSLGETNTAQGKLIIAFIRDVSERVKQEQKLRIAHDQALAATRAKSQFLAIMSHEMRTPLNGVMAILDLLEGTNLSPKQENYVATAATAAEILKQHVDDVLDLTCIQAGKFELFPRLFNLVELLEEVQSLFIAVAAKRGNRITLNVEMAQPYFIGDRKRIHQILSNLVSNANKFSERGRIVIDVTFVAVKADLVMLEFKVTDTGIGIARDQWDKIFEEFVTLDDSYQRSSAGTGLGLPICRSIVEAMGGVIGVVSSVGEKSTFWFRLPLKAAFGKSQRRVAFKRKPVVRSEFGLKVLVVEDNETNRFVAGEMLRAAGCDVVVAGDGREGGDIAETQRFDLILMDLSMPRMNGWDAARRIRARATSRSRDVPIYALTAHALPEEQAALKNAGMQGCILKPLRAKNLDALLQGLHSKKGISEQRLISDEAVDSEILSELHEVLGAAVFQEKLVSFLFDLKNGMRLMKAAADSDNKARLKALAHKFAGSAAVFGARKVQAGLILLEGTADRSGTDVRDSLACIRKALKQFEACSSAAVS